MGDAGYFKGISADQDSRFSNKEKKLLKTMNFPTEFDEKINMKNVNLTVIKPWMANRITQLLGFEDEVVIDFAFGLLEEEKPEPKRMQINLTGFLEKNTPIFMLDLWKLLLSAQKSGNGIPQEFLDQKKEELRLKKEQEERRRAEEEATMDTIRRKRASEQQDYPRRERRSRFDEPSSRNSRRSSPPPSSSYYGRRHHRRSRSPSPYHDRERHSHRPHPRRSRSRSPPPPPPSSSSSSSQVPNTSQQKDRNGRFFSGSNRNSSSRDRQYYRR